MNILVCGGRDYPPANVVRTLNRILDPNDVDVVVHGDANGADTGADLWAKSHGILVRVFPPDWKRHGRAAGILRNAQMLRENVIHRVYAFPGGNGTRDMVSRAHKAGIETWLLTE